jgi:nicotinamide-nucleotide amidase
MTVGDYPERLSWAWEHCFDQADVVISTGGLGPTADDLTNETLARVAGVALVLDQAEADRIRGFFERVGRSMPENNLRQAMLPAGYELIRNDLGTAPGYRLAVSRGGHRSVAVVLPGVPREMKPMVEQQVIPWLAASRGEETNVLSRTFQTFGMSESALDEALAGVVAPEEGRLAFRASFPEVSVRLSVMGKPDEARARLTDLGDRIAKRIGPAVYGEGSATMQGVVGELLRSRKETLAVAESCTGGLIGSRVTDVPGSSDYYCGGVVAYRNDVKRQVLGVSATTLRMFGAVSEETASEMAIGVRRLTGATVGLATTGIAGPGGGTPEKPVGTVAIALSTGAADEVRSKTYRLWGTRDWIKLLTSQVALDWVRRHALGLDPLDSGFGRRGR